MSAGVSEMWVKGKKKPEILARKPEGRAGLGQTEPSRQGEPRWTLVHREGCCRVTSRIHSAPLRQIQCSCSDRCSAPAQMLTAEYHNSVSPQKWELWVWVSTRGMQKENKVK